VLIKGSVVVVAAGTTGVVLTVQTFSQGGMLENTLGGGSGNRAPTRTRRGTLSGGMAFGGMHRCGGIATIANAVAAYTVIHAPMVRATVSTAPRKNVSIRARALKSSKHDDDDIVAVAVALSDAALQWRV
jgi:hypothetical protein